MTFKQTIALLMVLATTQLPCTTFAAEEDRDLALIAAEQEKSADDEKIGDINPALTDSLSIKHEEETDKEIKERKKKLKQTRKEKEKLNEQRLKDSEHRNKDRMRRNEPVVIKDDEPPAIRPTPPPQPVAEPAKPSLPPQSTVAPAHPVETQPVAEPAKPSLPPQSTVVPATPSPQPQSNVRTELPPPPPATEPVKPPLPPQSTVVPATAPAKPPTIEIGKNSTPIETLNLPSEKVVYANFVEVARAVHFTPLYMPRKSGYEITGILAGQGIVEIRYGRRWEPTVSLSVRTHKRADGEEPQDISGVTGVKWRVDTSTGTTLYIAKISDTEQVAAWAVGHYTFSAQSENLSFASFHSIVADELIELSTHYYLDV